MPTNDHAHYRLTFSEKSEALSVGARLGTTCESHSITDAQRNTMPFRAPKPPAPAQPYVAGVSRLAYKFPAGALKSLVLPTAFTGLLGLQLPPPTENGRGVRSSTEELMCLASVGRACRGHCWAASEAVRCVCSLCAEIGRRSSYRIGGLSARLSLSTAAWRSLATARSDPVFHVSDRVLKGFHGPFGRSAGCSSSSLSKMVFEEKERFMDGLSDRKSGDLPGRGYIVPSLDIESFGTPSSAGPLYR